MSFDLDGYVDVAERIREFYEKYPDGRLCSGGEPRVEVIDGKSFVWYHARAYRTEEDQHPGDGWAAEPVPGPTQFTKDSELMNAETAAWGRAIVACGFATKKIASAQEVRNRSGNNAHQSQFVAPENALDRAPAGDGSFVMPVGKHKNTPLSEIPRDYLSWCLENMEREDIKNAIREYFGLVTASMVGGGSGDLDIPFEATIDGAV